MLWLKLSETLEAAVLMFEKVISNQKTVYSNAQSPFFTKSF